MVHHQQLRTPNNLFLLLYQPSHTFNSVIRFNLYMLVSKILYALLVRETLFAVTQFSHPVVSYSLWPHGLQHTRLPSPSPTPGVCSNSCPSSWWCHPAISSLSPQWATAASPGDPPRPVGTSHLLWELKNYNSLLNNSRQEKVGSHQKKIPRIQGQRKSPRKTVGGEKSHLESTNPTPARDVPKAQTKPCVHQEAPQRLSQTCLWVFKCLLRKYRSAVACRLGYGISPLGGGHH